MAGRGSRLRPHTLTVPKPLVPVAGKPIVHRLVTDIAKVLREPIEEIAFVLGDPTFFGEEVVERLKELATGLGAKASIYRQHQPLGTGHAIMCAEPSLSGPAVIAYADTLIRADFSLDTTADSVIWVKQVPQPQAFGVVQLNEAGEIVALVEKPQTFVSDLAVIGIYYFKDVGRLKNELQYVLDHTLTHRGEYQINDGIIRMLQKGMKCLPGTVDAWMDCGNKQVTVETNRRMLDFLQKDGETLIADTLTTENANVIAPCFIGENAVIKNSTVGPYVSLGAGTVVENSTVKNSLIQNHSKITNANLDRAMIGNHVVFNGNFEAVSLGDYCTLA